MLLSDEKFCQTLARRHLPRLISGIKTLQHKSTMKPLCRSKLDLVYRYTPKGKVIWNLFRLTETNLHSSIKTTNCTIHFPSYAHLPYSHQLPPENYSLQLLPERYEANKRDRECKPILGYIGSNIDQANTKGTMPELSGSLTPANIRFGFSNISILNITEGKNTKLEPLKINGTVLKQKLNLILCHELNITKESNLLSHKVTTQVKTAHEVFYDRAQKWAPEVNSAADTILAAVRQFYIPPNKPDLLSFKVIAPIKNAREIFHGKKQPLTLKRTLAEREVLDTDSLRLVSSHKPTSLKIMPFPRTKIISWRIGSQIFDKNSIASSVIFHSLSAEEDSSATLTAMTALTAGANIRDRAREPPAVEMEHKAAGPPSIEMEQKAAWPLPVNMQYADIQSTPSHTDQKTSDQQTEERMINSTDAIQGQRYNQNTSHINIAKLSDQVQHIIERKIKIEKERRGIYV